LKPLVANADDDVYLTETNAQLGEIKVELHESLNIYPTSFKNQSKFSELGKVHERSKKAIGHQIGYVSWSMTTGVAHTPTGWVKKNDARLNTSPRFVVFVYWQPLSFVIVPSVCSIREILYCQEVNDIPDILRANGLAPPVPSRSLGQKRRITDDDDMIDLTLEDSDGELSRDNTEEIAALEVGT